MCFSLFNHTFKDQLLNSVQFYFINITVGPLFPCRANTNVLAHAPSRHARWWGQPPSVLSRGHATHTPAGGTGPSRPASLLTLVTAASPSSVPPADAGSSCSCSAPFCMSQNVQRCLKQVRGRWKCSWVKSPFESLLHVFVVLMIFFSLIYNVSSNNPEMTIFGGTHCNYLYLTLQVSSSFLRASFCE